MGNWSFFEACGNHIAKRIVCFQNLPSTDSHVILPPWYNLPNRNQYPNVLNEKLFISQWHALNAILKLGSPRTWCTVKSSKLDCACSIIKVKWFTLFDLFAYQRYVQCTHNVEVMWVRRLKSEGIYHVHEIIFVQPFLWFSLSSLCMGFWSICFLSIVPAIEALMLWKTFFKGSGYYW